MAINIEDDAPANTIGDIASKSSTPNTSNSTPKKKTSWSFQNSNNLASPIPKSMGSEYLNKLREGLATIYSDANPALEIGVITVDRNNETNLAFSSLVVTAKLKGKTELAYHVLLVENTGNVIQPLQETHHGKTYDIYRPSSVALDNDMYTVIENKLDSIYPQHILHSSAATVIPRDFNIADEHRLHELAWNTGVAVSTELEISSADFSDLNLAYVENKGKLNINMSFQRNQIEDAVGNPMRSDVMINLSSQIDQNVRQQSVNSTENNVGISELSGFMDLVWDPVAPLQNPMLGQNWNQNQPTPTQLYAARFVLTNVTSHQALTPSAVLLSVLTALSLSNDHNWFQAFRPTVTASNEVDITDIGAIGIEAPGVNAKIDTKSESFNLASLGALITTWIQPGLIFSLDVPDAAPQTWYLDQFQAAEQGNKEAYDVIVMAANILSNNRFSEFFKPGTPMFTDIGNRVHLGYYTDRNGQRRDIRDIDYLAIANVLGVNNPDVIRDWSDTFYRTDFPIGQRLFARKALINAVTRESAVFTGMASRITFSTEFLTALMKSTAEYLPVKINTPLSASDFNNERARAGFVNNGMVGTNIGFSTRDNVVYGVQNNMQFRNQRWNG